VQFKAVLEKAAKRFAALAKVEERHANHYKQALERAQAFADHETVAA
jgi:rubrerythrin